MQKIIFFLLAFISLSAHARANWNPFTMNHERFVHLTEEQKRMVIISTMELMVELESKYNHEVKTSGFSTERFQKYVQILQKFQNLIIGDAYAADPAPSITQLAGDFAKLLNPTDKKNKGNTCIYGGYVSLMATLNGHKYCRHPSTMRSNIPDEAAVKKAYLTRGTGATACVGPAKITCNPVIFGYQDTKGLVPLCVETSAIAAGKGHNVSYECMKKALAEPIKDRDERLAVLTKAMSENKEAFNKVHSFIFRTCACNDEDKIINKDYAAYMKPHRTCYGLMNTLRVVNTNECGQISKVVPGEEFANDWAKYFGNAAVFPKLEPEKSATFDKVYGSLIDKDAVAAICNGTPIKEEDPIVIVVPEPDKPVWFCETKCSKEEAKEGETAKLKCTVVNAGWKNPKDETRKPNSEELKVLLKSQEIIVDKADAITASVELADGTKQECPITTEETPAAGPTCSIAIEPIADDATKSKATVTIVGLKEKEEAVVVWTGGTATAELPNEITVPQTKGAAQDVSVVFTIKGAPVVEGAAALTCAGVIPPLVETDPTKINYVIDAKAEAALATTVLVNATITVEGKETPKPENYKISWSRTGSGVEKLPKPIEVKEKETTQVKDTDTESNEVKVEIPVVVVTKGEVATGPSITETRVAEEYSACATLIDDKGTPVAGPSCAPIAALKVEKTKPNQNNPYQQPQQQNQPSFNFQNMNTFTPGF